MLLKSSLLFAQCILFTPCVYQVNAQQITPIGHNLQNQVSYLEAREFGVCSDVTNIQVTFTTNGDAIITWDAISNVFTYHVIVTGSNQQVIFDDFVVGNQVIIPNAGYVIINDVIVMRN